MPCHARHSTSCHPLYCRRRLLRDPAVSDERYKSCMDRMLGHAQAGTFLSAVQRGWAHVLPRFGPWQGPPARATPASARGCLLGRENCCGEGNTCPALPPPPWRPLVQKLSGLLHGHSVRVAEINGLSPDKAVIDLAWNWQI